MDEEKKKDFNMKEHLDSLPDLKKGEASKIIIDATRERAMKLKEQKRTTTPRDFLFTRVGRISSEEVDVVEDYIKELVGLSFMSGYQMSKNGSARIDSKVLIYLLKRVQMIQNDYPADADEWKPTDRFK